MFGETIGGWPPYAAASPRELYSRIMARRKRMAPSDTVACIPLACYGAVFLLALLLSSLGALHAEAPFFALIGIVLITGSLSFLAAGATGFHTLLVTLDDLVEGRWRLSAQKRLLGRAALSGVGFLLCWAELGRLLSVTID